MLKPHEKAASFGNFKKKKTRNRSGNATLIQSCITHSIILNTMLQTICDNTQWLGYGVGRARNKTRDYNSIFRNVNAVGGMTRARRDSLFIIYSTSSNVRDDNKSKTSPAAIHLTTQNRLFSISVSPILFSTLRLSESLALLSGSLSNSLVR